MATDFYSTAELAAAIGRPTWQVQRLFEENVLPEPKKRFGNRRVIPASLVPQVIEALRQRFPTETVK